MDQRDLPRRTILKGAASAGAVGMTVVNLTGPAEAFPGHADGGVTIPWLDQPPPVPPELEGVLGHPLVWEQIRFLTPNDEFFTVKHYDLPHLSATAWRLGVTGLVANPLSLTLRDVKALPRRAVTYALECSGNQTSTQAQVGLVGNARWAGASLRQVLKAAGPLDKGIDVVFRGADAGQVTIRDNPAVTGPGETGAVEPDTAGGLDLTITEQFARSMSLEDAMHPDNLLCYEMNGEPLPRDHGAPVRLIAPDWYGVANVKWLTGIEIISSRYQGRFMARDYVTIRERRRGGKIEWTFTSVTHERLKSAPAKVVRRDDEYTVLAAAWGAPVAKVEVRVDGGAWQAAKPVRHLTGGEGRHRHASAWSFWTRNLGTLRRGEHSITSRAYDRQGHVQPAPEDPSIANRRTYYENNGYVTRRVLVA